MAATWGRVLRAEDALRDRGARSEAAAEGATQGSAASPSLGRVLCSQARPAGSEWLQARQALCCLLALPEPPAGQPGIPFLEAVSYELGDGRAYWPWSLGLKVPLISLEHLD